MTTSNTTTESDRTPPGANSYAHYITWLQELSELRAAGLIDVEDYALSRAERLESLFELPGAPWRKWLFGGLPASLIAGSIVSYMDGRMEALGIGMGIACLCVLAAIGTHSRVSAGNLTVSQRLEILRTLLERDLISADEFGVFEQRIIGAH